MQHRTDRARMSCLAGADLSYFICSLCRCDNMSSGDQCDKKGQRWQSKNQQKDSECRLLNDEAVTACLESGDSSVSSSALGTATGFSDAISDYTDAGTLSRTLSLESLDKDKATKRRKSRTLTFRRKKSDKVKDPSNKQGRFWTFRLKKHLPVRLKKEKEHGLPEASDPGIVEKNSCVCTGYRRTEDHALGPGVVFNAKSRASISSSVGASPIQASALRQHRLSMGAGPGPSGLSSWNTIIPAPQPPALRTSIIEVEECSLPCEDIDEIRIAQRARDMEQGIDHVDIAGGGRGGGGGGSHGTYPHLRYSNSTTSSSASSSSGSSSATAEQIWNLAAGLQNQCLVTTTTTTYPVLDNAMAYGGEPSMHSEEYGVMPSPNGYIPRTVHTQVDYVHCLVPDLQKITSRGFYWGVMDRYEAEKLLENRPEGTFLLRDSAQEEFLFSVSFRRYGRSLHARLEQWNHKFSFDSHDPGVFASNTVCGLIEHYKDPSCCMFFEPMLTISLNRTYPFSLQHLCRSVIAGYVTYDSIMYLPLPKPMKEYLKYYHYKQKVRVRRFEVHA